MDGSGRGLEELLPVDLFSGITALQEEIPDVLDHRLPPADVDVLVPHEWKLRIEMFRDPTGQPGPIGLRPRQSGFEDEPLVLTRQLEKLLRVDEAVTVTSPEVQPHLAGNALLDEMQDDRTDGPDPDTGRNEYEVTLPDRPFQRERTRGPLDEKRHTDRKAPDIIRTRSGWKELEGEVQAVLLTRWIGHGVGPDQFLPHFEGDELAGLEYHFGRIDEREGDLSRVLREPTNPLDTRLDRLATLGQGALATFGGFYHSEMGSSTENCSL